MFKEINLIPGNHLNVRWLRYTRDKLGQIFYKESLSAELPFKSMSILRRGTTCDQITKPLPSSYMALSISKEKKKDIIDLLPLTPKFIDFTSTFQLQIVPEMKILIFTTIMRIKDNRML